MAKSIGEILVEYPKLSPRIYAYAIDDEQHRGQLKIGQTSRDVKTRIVEQLRSAAINNFTIELDESASKEDGNILTDHQVRAALIAKGFERVELEWMRCSVNDVHAVLTELRLGKQFDRPRNSTFPMRDEQTKAVEKAIDYFHSIWRDNMRAVPRFLWNAKMRFGKTFAT